MSEQDLSALVNPPENISNQAHVGSLDAYRKEYQKSIEDPFGQILHLNFTGLKNGIKLVLTIITWVRGLLI